MCAPCVRRRAHEAAVVREPCFTSHHQTEDDDDDDEDGQRSGRAQIGALENTTPRLTSSLRRVMFPLFLEA